MCENLNSSAEMLIHCMSDNLRPVW